MDFAESPLFHPQNKQTKRTLHANVDPAGSRRARIKQHTRGHHCKVQSVITFFFGFCCGLEGHSLVDWDTSSFVYYIDHCYNKCAKKGDKTKRNRVSFSLQQSLKGASRKMESVCSRGRWNVAQRRSSDSPTTTKANN